MIGRSGSTGSSRVRSIQGASVVMARVLLTGDLADQGYVSHAGMSHTSDANHTTHPDGHGGRHREPSFAGTDPRACPSVRRDASEGQRVRACAQSQALHALMMWWAMAIRPGTPKS